MSREELESRIKTVGDTVRILKNEPDVDKIALTAKVTELKALKESLEHVSGTFKEKAQSKKSKVVEVAFTA
jgi:hypothetical protein